jgi:uncharacterized RDD family membrane protein YckC
MLPLARAKGGTMGSPAPDLSLAIPSFGGYADQAGLQGVSFWPRAFARLIDTVIHYCVGFVVGILFVIMLTIASGGHVPPLILRKISHTGLPLFVAGLAGMVAYHVIFTVVHGSSVGKQMLSIVVVREDGTPCGIKAAIVRELGFFVDSLFFGLIGYLAMQKNAREQRYGDEWAETVACKRSAVQPEALRGAGRFVLALMFALMADAAILMIGLLVQLNG